MNNFELISEKINNNNELIGVIGLGYVGLPLAVSFALENNRVLGFEKSEEKTRKVNSGINFIGDIDDKDLKAVVDNKNLSATTDFTRIKECDAILICVPTPLDVFKKPDMSYIESACIDIGKNISPRTFISLESTTYPTTTEDFMLPIIEKESGLKHGEDFWLAFSPERVDPGNKEYFTRNMPKVLGALTEDGLKIGESIYKKAIDNIHLVSSPRVAEMVKILENTYRLINISLINEMALLCGKMNINIWEVIEAAKTKPFGFQAFYPGPGIGGHCIPLDPFYLEHIAKKFNFDLTMIHTAGHVNLLMAHRMTLKINSALNQHKKSINGSKILFMGVAYKPDINDERESPALKIMDEVSKKSGLVYYYDPYIPKVKTPEGNTFSSIDFSPEKLEDFDCIVITTNHVTFDPEVIVQYSPLIVDLRNLIKTSSDKVYKL